MDKILDDILNLDEFFDSVWSDLAKEKVNIIKTKKETDTALEKQSFEITTELICSKKYTIIHTNNTKYLIGVDVCKYIGRDTFNFYRSLKVKEIIPVRATGDQVDYLLKNSLVKKGTRSVTLIPYDVAVDIIRKYTETIIKELENGNGLDLLCFLFKNDIRKLINGKTKEHVFKLKKKITKEKITGKTQQPVILYKPTLHNSQVCIWLDNGQSQ